MPIISISTNIRGNSNYPGTTGPGNLEMVRDDFEQLKHDSFWNNILLQSRAGSAPCRGCRFYYPSEPSKGEKL